MQGISNQPISVDAVDPETGIKNATFAYWNCTIVDPNATITTLVLSCASGTCSGAADLSNYREGDDMCFQFSVYNKGGDSSTLTGAVGFDGTAPTVSLISPANNSVENGSVDFVFNATDNLAPTLSCNLLFDNTIEDSATATSGEHTGLTYDVSLLSEASHAWKVSCVDGVGLQGMSETRNVLTGEGPEINLTMGTVERTIDYTLNMSITDETAVDEAYAVFENTTIALTEQGGRYIGILSTALSHAAGNYTLTVFANDTLGFSTTNMYTFELVQGYLISLTLNPSTAEPSETVNASGSVSLDDGGDIPESNISLALVNSNVSIAVINQSFSYSFTAPGATGAYTIRASVVSSNNFSHVASADLTVATSQAQSSQDDNGPSGGGRGGIYCGDGNCGYTETCSNCAADCGVCPTEPEEEGEEGDTQSSGFFVNEGEEVPEEEPRTPAGVGAASFWFGKLVANPWIWVLFLTILVSLYIFSHKKKSSRRGKVNWKGYFDK